MVQGEVDRGGAVRPDRAPRRPGLRSGDRARAAISRRCSRSGAIAPRDDLISALLAAEIDGERLNDIELIGFALPAARRGQRDHHEPASATPRSCSTATATSAACCSRTRRCIPGAIEEFLRYDSPVQGLARTRPRAVTLHGVTIPEGKKVLLLFGSANRDERAIPDADRFDVLREPNPHVAFGFGAHFCLGANLARLEARVAFEELLRASARLPEDGGAGGAPHLRTDPRRTSPADRGTLTRVPAPDGVTGSACRRPSARSGR